MIPGIKKPKPRKENKQGTKVTIVRGRVQVSFAPDWYIDKQWSIIQGRILFQKKLILNTHQDQLIVKVKNEVVKSILRGIFVFSHF